MASDDIVERLRMLSERLDRLRRQAKEVQNVASDEVRTAYTNAGPREMPNLTERRATKRR